MTDAQPAGGHGTLASTSRPVTAAPSGRAPRPWLLPALTGAVTAGATVLVGLHTPYAAGSYGVCPVVLGLGAWCPACGGLRAVHELTQGDLVGAWSMNAPFVALAPVVVAVWLLWMVSAIRGRPAPVRAPVWLAWVSLAAFLLFGVLRNTPALAPWLAPGGVLPPFLGAG